MASSLHQCLCLFLSLLFIPASSLASSHKANLWIKSDSLDASQLVRREKTHGATNADEQDECAIRRKGYAIRQRLRESDEQIGIAYLRTETVAEVPTARQVKAWGSQVAVVIDGPSLVTGEATHYYNLMTVVVPYLLKYVANPLVENGMANSTTIMLRRQKPFQELGCHAGAAQESGLLAQRDLTRAAVEERTASQLHARCQSVIEMLPALLPNNKIQFEDDLAFCSDSGDCKGGEMERKDTVLLVLPDSIPVQANDQCGPELISTVRHHFASIGQSGAGSATETKQVTLIGRGVDLKDPETPFDLDRTDHFITNMGELNKSVSKWAKENGLDFQMVEFERLTVQHQMAVINRTKILIGVEGAGLANMLFFPDPAKANIVELNWKGGKTSMTEEYPMLAKAVGVPLKMHVYGELGDDVNPGQLLKVLDSIIGK